MVGNLWYGGGNARHDRRKTSRVRIPICRGNKKMLKGECKWEKLKGECKSAKVQTNN
jgi:hypothetical protein